MQPKAIISYLEKAKSWDPPNQLGPDTTVDVLANWAYLIKKGWMSGNVLRDHGIVINIGAPRIIPAGLTHLDLLKKQVAESEALEMRNDTREDWIKEHDALNKVFQSGAILSVSRKVLEQHLLTTSEIKIEGDPNRQRNERRANVIRHLLQIRISEEIAGRSLSISRWALIISISAFLVTVIRALWGD